MINRGMSIALFFLMGGICSAQSGSILNLPSLNHQGAGSFQRNQLTPLPAQTPVKEYTNTGDRIESIKPVPEPVPMNGLTRENAFPKQTPVKQYTNYTNNFEEEPVAYEYPQAHHYSRSAGVGYGQSAIHRGYWLPGGYEGRAGSPYFYSVPGAPARGPLAGINASGYTGGNGYNTGVYGNSYGSGNGYNNGAAMSGGAGGDPYQYHFGPGFYRSGEHGHFRFPYYSYRRPWYHPGFAGYNRDTNLPW